MRSAVLEVRAETGLPLLPNGLSEVFWVLQPKKDSLQFSILEFEGTLKAPTCIPYEELKRRAADSVAGLVLTWDELVACFDDVADIFDLLLVGYSKREVLPARGTFEQLTAEAAVVVEVFDSSVLRLFLADDALLARARDVFPSARIGTQSKE